MVVRCEVKPAPRFVPEQLDLLVGQSPGVVEPGLVAGGLMQCEEPFNQEGVVDQVGLELGASVAMGSQQVALGRVSQLVDQECGRAG